MPPPVEPAQAPMNMSTTRHNRENSGHMSKSTAGKSGGGDDGRHLKGGVADAVAGGVHGRGGSTRWQAVLTATMMRKNRNSSLLSTCFTLPHSSRK